MSRLERAAAVLLRVPGLVLLDLLHRWDVQSSARLLRPQHRPLQGGHVWSLYYLGHVLCAVLLMLPVRYLVKMYHYLLTLMLLYVGHQTARDYIRQEMESAYQGAVYRDTIALSRVVTALTGQVILSTLCSLLMKTKQVWLFSAPMLPLMARLSGVPLQTLPVVNTFATILTGLEVLYVVASNLFLPLNLAKTACREVAQVLEVLEVYRLVALALTLWNQLAVPVLFLVFWLVLFGLQVYFFLTSHSSQLTQQGLLFVFLNSVAECCGTPYSLIGLTFTISYLALGMLNLCKFYLLGFGAFQNGNVMHRGVTEGVTLLLLALQTGLLDLQVLQRTFLLSIILFIVVTSILQSMIEITDPIVLALGASRNRSPWKHIRGVSMCLFLLVFPSFMAYKISRFFHMDFWLLILVSSCMLTSLQVMGTLFIYALFMIELFQDNPVEKMDEIIYYVNAVSRVLEFLVAVCVVCYGTWESIYGEWSWMGASVIIIHSYFNVWLRAQSGWKSFLLRREAAKKINLLPKATKEQLHAHNDVCAICFQEMGIAVITSCGHFFHTGCLRKWLYIQDTCPMCHQQVNPPSSERDQSHPVGEREEEQADGDGSALAVGNEDAAAKEREESEPTGGNERASAQGMEECDPVAEKDVAAKMEPYSAAWNEDAALQGGEGPNPAVGNEDLNGEEFSFPCFRFSKALSEEQRLALSGMAGNTKILLNQETLHPCAAGEGNICVAYAGAHVGHNTGMISLDNFSGTHKGEVQVESEAVGPLKDTAKEQSQGRLMPGEFQEGLCSSGPSCINTEETFVQTSDLETVANDSIPQSLTHCKDGHHS